MPRRKKKKMIPIAEKPQVKSFVEKIKELSEGLYYISETDAEILPFEGNIAETVTKEELLRQTNNEPNAPVEERIFTEIFARLTKTEDWFGDEEKATSEKFLALQEFLEENLKDLKVFKIGRIQIDIYFVGLDESGKLMGIQTKAVET